MIKIAFVDIIGLTYDGNTLKKRGLGGSESAVILLSKELVKIGFDVTVFNNCIDREASPGTYDGVKYIDHTSLDKNNNYYFDVVISSRTVVPFLNEELYSSFSFFKPERYKNIKSKFKAMWMHDTFSRGDEFLEDLLLNGNLDEIFTLSDFHMTYVTNCSHGKKRNFEVLKNKVFLTRNGIVSYNDEVDIKKKDPFLYVFNASVTKGMIPLVENIWPKIKEKIPKAKLKVIGGFYRFRENAKPDEQEKKWRQLVADDRYKKLDVEFTGIIKQSEIADILTKSSFMIYPASFPETFGISTLESLNYNTPLITSRFGALEETAIEQASYLNDYPIEPNGLFPHINKDLQEKKFVETVLKANSDRYLHQQKMYYCNIIKDVIGWDSVALQWKQHLYKKLKQYLPLDNYKKVSYINQKVHKVFGRRFYNNEEHYLPRKKEQKIVCIIPFYNSSNYITKCLDSILTQDYENYEIILIDDNSNDNVIETLNSYLDIEKIKFKSNSTNKGAVRNQIESIKEYCNDNDIVMLIDGDDSLVNDNQIFHFYNNLYDDNTDFTYGSCWSMVDKIPLIAQPYPKEVKEKKEYRKYRFNWNMPYTHLRTFKASLLNNLSDENFKDDKGNWYKAGGDGSVFYTLIEKCDPEKIKVVTDIVYNYNDENPLNDYKINSKEQNKNSEGILKK